MTKGLPLLKRLGCRCQDEHGVVLIMVAVMMTVFIAMGAIAIDLGSYWQAQRQAQAAADAGALAAAQDLSPAKLASAAGDGTTYASQNFPGASVNVDTTSNTNQVTVQVNANTPTFFGGFLSGKSSVQVGARAVAGAKSTSAPCTTAGNTCYAIFAGDTSCSTTAPPVAGGGGNHFTGGVHSNGSINVGGGGSSFGDTTYGNGAGCTVGPAKWAQNNNTFTSGPTAEAPILTPTLAPAWPIDYTQDFPPCGSSPLSACTGACDLTTTPCPAANKTPNFCTQAFNASKTLDTYNQPYVTSNNIYCDVGTGTASTPSTWNGALTVAGGPVESTFVAGTVTFGGGTYITACGYALPTYNVAGCTSNVPVPPTGNYPVAYAISGGTSLDASAGNFNPTGDLFAPAGKILMGGGSATSFMEALDVTVSAGGITGDGPSGSSSGSGTSVVSLLQ